jgi:hypothetical protein
MIFGGKFHVELKVGGGRNNVGGVTNSDQGPACLEAGTVSRPN